jgi:hypothetical protein
MPVRHPFTGYKEASAFNFDDVVGRDESGKGAISPIMVGNSDKGIAGYYGPASDLQLVAACPGPVAYY